MEAAVLEEAQPPSLRIDFNGERFTINDDAPEEAPLVDEDHVQELLGRFPRLQRRRKGRGVNWLPELKSLILNREKWNVKTRLKRLNDVLERLERAGFDVEQFIRLRATLWERLFGISDFAAAHPLLYLQLILLGARRMLDRFDAQVKKRLEEVRKMHPRSRDVRSEEYEQHVRHEVRSELEAGDRQMTVDSFGFGLGDEHEEEAQPSQEQAASGSGKAEEVAIEMPPATPSVTSPGRATLMSLLPVPAGYRRIFSPHGSYQATVAERDLRVREPMRGFDLESQAEVEVAERSWVPLAASALAALANKPASRSAGAAGAVGVAALAAGVAAKGIRDVFSGKEKPSGKEEPKDDRVQYVDVDMLDEGEKEERHRVMLPLTGGSHRGGSVESAPPMKSYKLTAGFYESRPSAVLRDAMLRRKRG